jgi:GAF domain-containing protein
MHAPDGPIRGFGRQTRRVERRVAVLDQLIPDNEAERMAAVRRYDVLDTPRDGAFDRITRIACSVFNMPIAIVSIVDEDRIWFKSAAGLEGVEEIGRDPGLCASAILGDEPWVINDARVDPRSLSNPLVAGDFGLRFYAGSPLTTGDGFRLGTLCVIDRQTREVTTEQLAVLDDLAAIVIDELELRLAARRTAHQVTELNDDVVQRLAVAKLAFDMGQPEQVGEAITEALGASKRILSELAAGSSDLRRSTP